MGNGLIGGLVKKYTSGGMKDTTGKAPLHLVTRKMVEGIANGLECGLRKGYEQDNWKKGLPISEGHLGAALRHIYKYLDGEDINIEIAKDGTEFPTHHLDNALTHLAMAVHQIKSGRSDLDDRTATKFTQITLGETNLPSAKVYLKSIASEVYSNETVQSR